MDHDSDDGVGGADAANAGAPPTDGQPSSNCKRKRAQGCEEVCVSVCVFVGISHCI